MCSELHHAGLRMDAVRMSMLFCSLAVLDARVGRLTIHHLCSQRNSSLLRMCHTSLHNKPCDNATLQHTYIMSAEILVVNKRIGQHLLNRFPGFREKRTAFIAQKCNCLRCLCVLYAIEWQMKGNVIRTSRTLITGIKTKCRLVKSQP